MEKSGKSSGWVVLGPEGQTLRRFVDSDGNNYVDQWRYFKNGIEVYRDLDATNNNKVDQSRWLNTGGSRWGLDPNEDGRIDSWKVLSAEEASREAVRALCAGFPGEYWRKLDRERAYPAEFVAALTEAGFLAALIPEEYGGSGLPMSAAAAILEEVHAPGCSRAASRSIAS